MEIETDLAAPVGRVFDMEVRLRENTLPVQGRIVNVRAETGNRPLNHLGIEFVDVSNEHQKLLEAFIEQELER